MYKKKDVILSGFALFAMLFGAGNLIFPPTLGYELGSNWKIATLAFVLTGVGMPLLGLLASFLSGKDNDSFANKVSPLFSKIFNICLVISIGPLLAMPRTGAAAYEITFYHAGLTSNLMKTIYLGIYFLIALFFSLKSSKVIDRIGSILTPILLIVLVIMLVRGIYIHPGVIEKTYDYPFKRGFIEGYQTMDTLATIVFARIILKSISNKEKLTPKQEFTFLLKVSLIATIGLAIVYSGLAYIGSGMSGVNLAQGFERTDLLTKIAVLSLGKLGYLILAICVAGACLTTAIGLIVTTGDYFHDLTGIAYEKIVIVATIVGFYFAYFGVDYIIKISAPILVFLYPIAMALIFLNLCRVKSKNIFRGSILFTSLIGLYECLMALGVNISPIIKNIYDILPFSHYGLAWICPALIGALIFLPFREKNK